MRSAPISARRFHLELNGDPEQRIAEVAQYVAGAYRMPVEKIYCASRDARYVRARHVTMYLALEMGYSTVVVGRALKRDHSTVMYGRDRIAAFIDTDERLRAAIEAFWFIVTKGSRAA